MSGTLQIGLRAGEQIYINGAVLRVDRKVRLELLNDATFLLGSHVMQLEAATTPVRQLYFLIQGQLMDPSVAPSLRPAIEASIADLRIAANKAGDTAQSADLIGAWRLIEAGRVFEALRSVRRLVNQEDQQAASAASEAAQAKEVA